MVAVGTDRTFPVAVVAYQTVAVEALQVVVVAVEVLLTAGDHQTDCWLN